MKQMLVVAVVAMLPAAVLAGDCMPVADYRVGHVAYKARPLEQSLLRMLRGSPYKVVVEGGPQMTARTRRIVGPLSLTLDKLAGQFGMQWQQEDCLLRYTSKEAASTPTVQSRVAITPLSPVAEVRTQDSSGRSLAPSWSLQADRPIHLQFADWARTAGWSFEWRLEKSWLVPAATQFGGTFDEALAKAVEALHAQGKPVRLILWEGNRFAEIVDVDAK